MTKHVPRDLRETLNSNLEIVSESQLDQAPPRRRPRWPRKVCGTNKLELSIARCTRPSAPQLGRETGRWAAKTENPRIHLRPRANIVFFPNTAKSRTIAVRLISMAMTGYYRTMIRPRVHRPLSMMKYDPVVKKQVLFLEATKGGKNK
ncbi:hypothetical protein N7447_001901 [Penicillium robsamsonii]|uniref:uncharacterized protein n=1 Tax=Penicillium robsamsonii TaxID=1792511 RepID=UPI0025465E33|nr:uncharacterized protein N7447_001901 [Penicillium robsamsonii]KAJ5835875.1 hypothetical protein N7447_001901 [Penicillium robsamsonii]